MAVIEEQIAGIVPTRSRVSPTWASAPLDGDVLATLSSLEQSLPISLVATFDLSTCRAHQRVAEVRGDAALKGFDHIPVLDKHGTIIGVFNRDDATPTGKRVGKVMQRLHQSVLISANSGILTFIEEADRSPYRLVLVGRAIRGIVTLSDLQKLAVRPVLFYLITHLELLLAAWLRGGSPNDEWFKELEPADQKLVAKEWKKKSKDNFAIDRLACTSFSQKALLAVKTGAFRNGPAAAEHLKDAQNLRNSVAHAGDYALTPSNAKWTARTARQVRALVEELQTKITHLRPGIAGSNDNGRAQGDGEDTRVG